MLDVAGNAEVQKIYQIWSNLSDDQKEVVIPELLEHTRTWQAWSTSDTLRREWLRSAFAKAGKPFGFRHIQA